MGKCTTGLIILLIRIALLPGCTGRAEREFAQYINSRPAGPTMPYDSPQFILDSVPKGLPFAFSAPENSDLLGTLEDEGHGSGTILLVVQQRADDILRYYTNLLTDEAFIRDRERYHYQVFFPAEGNAAAFCSDQDRAIFLEIFDIGDGLNDVRLHYTSDEEVIARTHCGQPVQAPEAAVEGFPFPYLAAPTHSIFVGGGGGGGSSHGRYSGFSATAAIVSGDSLEAVNEHYHKLLAAEGWTLLGQSSSDSSLESSWDSGYHEARSWLAQLIVSRGDAPDQYRVELRSVSP